MINIKLEDLEVNRDFQDLSTPHINMLCKCWLYITDSNIGPLPLYFRLDAEGNIVVQKTKTFPLISLILSFHGTSAAIANDDNIKTLQNFSGFHLDAQTISSVRIEIENFIEYLQTLI